MRLVRRLSSTSSSGSDQTGFQGVGADTREVEAGAVVVELDHRVVAFVGDLRVI